MTGPLAGPAQPRPSSFRYFEPAIQRSWSRSWFLGAYHHNEYVVPSWVSDEHMMAEVKKLTLFKNAMASKSKTFEKEQEWSF